MTDLARTDEGASAPNPTTSSFWDGRGVRARLLRDVLLPVLAFLLPILALVGYQRLTVGGSLFLGWDSSTYAWWAVLVQSQGVPAALNYWHYPHLYVLALSGLGWLLGDLILAEQVLPILVGIPLALAYHRLTVDLTGRPRLGLLAAFLGGISVDTIYFVADLQRNLLAMGVALIVGASIQRRLLSEPRLTPRAWVRALVVWIPLLLVVLGTQIETYVVLAIALLFGSLLTRRLKRCVAGIGLIAAPVAITAPLIWVFLTGYTSETSMLLPFGLVDLVLGAWLFFSGVAVVFVLVGSLALYRKAKSGDPTAKFLGLWLLTLVVLVPVAYAIHIPPTRLILVVPMPILLVLSLPTLRRWIAFLAREARGWLRASGKKPSTAQHGALPPGRQERFGGVASLALAVFLLAAPLAITTATTQGQYLTPYVSQVAVADLWQAGDLVHSLGYSNAILVLYGPSSAYYAPIYRAYFGMRVPENVAYYGKLQFLFSLQDSTSVYAWKYDPALEASYAQSFASEIESRLGITGIRTWPVVIAGNSTYPLPAAEAFLAPYERAPQIYVIPPSALTAQALDTWRLFAYADCYACGLGSPRPANWSESKTVLEYLQPWGSAAVEPATFNATYVFHLQQPWTRGNLSLRFWDWPASVGNASFGIVRLAPLTVLLDGVPILTHSYGGQGPLRISASVGPIAAGDHKIQVLSGAPGYGIAVDLDDLEFVPLS